MKKFLGILMAALLLSSCNGTNRENILKVYNWGDYIDESLINEFEQWYEQETGEPVKIVYQTFDVNETMLSKIELGHEDYDVVCPSEYIIERMLKNDLLLPINKDFGNTPNYINNISPFIIDYFDQIDGSGKNANEYSVGYMWGTTGMIYNTKYVTPDDVSSWNILQDKRFKGKILMKEAFRDVYTALLVAMNRKAIDAGEKDIKSLTFDCSDESIAMVENFLNNCRDNIAGWEADFGKEYMTKEQGWINLSWSGDAQWAIEEAQNIGVSLDYSIPKDGSIIWFDGWVIPKYAQNVNAARYFINFMCKPENALRNMDAIGYVSVIGGEEILTAQVDSTDFEAEDVSYFFGPDATNVHINPIMYPSADIVKHCGMMHDNGDATKKLLDMWIRVKGDNATNFTYIVIALVIIFAISAGVFSRVRKKSRKAHTKKH